MDAKLIEELTAGMPSTAELGGRDTLIDPPGEGQRPAPRDDSLKSLLAEARRSIVTRSPTSDDSTGYARLGKALAKGSPADFADTVFDRPPTALPRPAARARHEATVRVAAPRLVLEDPSTRGSGVRFAAALAGLGALGIAVGTSLGLIFRAL